MSVLASIFAKRAGETATVAKERLHLVLAHERASREAPDFLLNLQRDLLRVVSKYVAIGDDALKVAVDRRGATSVLEINVELDHSSITQRDPPRPTRDKAGISGKGDQIGVDGKDRSEL